MTWIPLVLFLLKNPDLQKLDHQKVQLMTGVLNCQKTEKVPFPITAEIVSVRESMEKGLSHRSEPLHPNEGMLFIYSQPKVIQIWMKETLIPLTVAFYGSHSTLLNQFLMPVEKNPDSPEIIYSSQGMARAALELAPGRSPVKKGVLCVGVKTPSP